MAKKKGTEAQNPLIIRVLRLIEAFAKSDDERDFYLDRNEGFIVYVDLSKPQETLDELEAEIANNSDRYCLIPKLSYYETKKIMENFVNEKVYDIDTKEKLLDVIQSKEARENFLEFIYDQHTELDKWQQFYQERSRIRIIEWLRNNHFHFVFEEDLDLNIKIVEQLKENLFESKVSKELTSARKTLVAKAKTYYSNEALNPRPKRGRPPKQNAKPDVETETSADIYLTVPSLVRPFLFIPDISGISAATFSAKFDSEEDLLKSMKTSSKDKWKGKTEIEELNRNLGTLRNLSKGWADSGSKSEEKASSQPLKEENDKVKVKPKPVKPALKKAPPSRPIKKMALKVKTEAAPKKKPAAKKPVLRSIIKKEKEPPKKAKAAAPKKKAAAPKAKKAPAKKRIIPKPSEKGKKPVRKIITDKKKSR